MGSRDHDTRTTRHISDFYDIYLDALVGHEGLALDLLVLCEITIDLAQIYDDRTSGIPLDGTGYDLLLHGVVLLIENLALLFTDLLHDHALCILGRDTSEALGIHLHRNDGAQRVGWIDQSGIGERNLGVLIENFLYDGLIRDDGIITGVRIYADTHIVGRTEMILACSLE